VNLDPTPTIPPDIGIEAESILLGDADDFGPGWMVLDHGRIAECGPGPYPGTPDLRVGRHIAPGFVDVHGHGGGGASFGDGPEAAATVIATHRRHGTTTQVASLVTAAWPDLMAQTDALRPLVQAGHLAGVHLEGPWLAPAKRGAHNPALLAAPTTGAVADVAARADIIKMVTLAPELPGALDAVERLARARVTTAVGHTEADYTTTQLAIASGARGATHLFNAMPPLLHRDPGPVLALLEAPPVFCELIVDGHHLDLDLALAVFRLLGPRAVLVTDAMAAAELGDGDYELGGLPVTVTAGVARLSADPGHAIAGSTITLEDAIVHAVAGGIPLARAVAAATRQPADYLGLGGVGRIVPGAWANFAELTPEGRVERVVFHGQAWSGGDS
jgi:N-acetylglucosamine-6-phosphate deacetylase